MSARGEEPGQSMTIMTTVSPTSLRCRIKTDNEQQSSARPNIGDQAGLLQLRSNPILPHLISSMSQDWSTLDIIYQTVPGAEAFRQEKPKFDWHILLQETEGMRNEKRWTVVARTDSAEYGNWYARNVQDGTAKTAKVEVHVLVGEAEDGVTAEGQGNFLEELQEMGKGNMGHARRLTSPYRQLKKQVQGQRTMLGGPVSGSRRFEDVRLDEIREAIIDKCCNAKYYEEAPSTHDWLPLRVGRGKRRRGKHRPTKYKKMRGRRSKRARTDDGAQDTMNVDEEDGRPVGNDDEWEDQDDEELESNTAHKARQASGSNSSEASDDDGADAGLSEANLDRPLVIRGRRQANNGNEDGAPSGSDVGGAGMQQERYWSVDMVVGKRRR